MSKGFGVRLRWLVFAVVGTAVQGQESHFEQNYFEPVATLTGFPAVVDGDGLTFGRIEVRLQGIAAPELSDPGGSESRLHLQQVVGNHSVECLLDGTLAGAGRRPVGVCFVEGKDVGLAQVLSGNALDCPRYSKGRYQQAENTAIAHGMKLRSQYVLPGYCR